ncbi:hypothetical protein IJ380_02465 [Candidatus Saccharibacteria bacterium]|nr:hypothetical protein [Candidatus Saccharibacteria bacterium]
MSDEIREARTREESFVSHVSIPKTEKKKSKKKRGPLFLVVILLALAAGLIFLSQTMMPFAIINRFREEFNSIGISSTLRADNLLDLQLSSAGSTFELSSTQRTAFKESNIYPVDFTADGRHGTALVFEATHGNFRAVVPNEIAENVSGETINSAVSSALRNPEISLSLAPLSTKEAMELSAFKEKYASASKTWRGGSSGWYDSIMDLTEARLAISRTRYSNWATVVLNSGTKEAWKKLASGNYRARDSGVSSFGTIVDVDENGNEVPTTNSGTIDSSSLTSQTTVDGVRNALNSKITSVAKVAATAGCAGVEILSAIHTVMSAQQSLQYLNLATGYFEAVQSVQAGKNDGAPMNEYNDALTRKDPETGKTAMESAGLSSLFSGTKVSSSDESVKTTNFETLMSSLGTLTGNVNFTAKAFQACSYIRMGVAAANFATTILNFIPVLGQATTAIHIVAKVVGKLALGISVGAIASFIIPKILAHVTKNIISNVATEWTGEDLGNALSSGANKYLGGNFQTGGGTAASKESLAVYRRAQETVLAEEAEFDRKTRSPFDITSNNTFLGSLTYSLIPLATTSSLGASIKTFGNLVSNSLTTLLPSASAIAETDLMDSIGECPLLESVGLIGDPYCNPYFVTEVSTISDSPEEIVKKVEEFDSNNFLGEKENGQKIINPKSNLGKKILICDQRIAGLGIADATAASILVDQPSTLVGNIPLLGDIAEITSALQTAENQAWISGLACGNTPENPYREEIEVYSRYTEDERLFEAEGIFAKSAATALVEDFYEKNPLDNSYEGILARYSGMTKEDVIATLDYIDALKFIADYNPETRKNFSENSVPNKTAYAIIESCLVNRSCETQRTLPSAGMAILVRKVEFLTPAKPKEIS